MSQLNISPCGGTLLKFNLNAEIPDNFKWNKKHRLHIKTLNSINNQRFTLKLNFNTVPEQKKGEILSCDKDPDDSQTYGIFQRSFSDTPCPFADSKPENQVYSYSI
jgi:hypothetical protein